MLKMLKREKPDCQVFYTYKILFKNSAFPKYTKFKKSLVDVPELDLYSSSLTPQSQLVLVVPY